VLFNKVTSTQELLLLKESPSANGSVTQGS